MHVDSILLLLMLNVLDILCFIPLAFNYGAKVFGGMAAKSDVVTCKK